MARVKCFLGFLNPGRPDHPWFQVGHRGRNALVDELLVLRQQWGHAFTQAIRA